MQTIIRQYSGENASKLFDLLEKNSKEVEGIMRDVPGFVSYTLFRTVDGGASVTVCKSKAGTDESSKRAAAWVKQHMTAKTAPPAISEGQTIIELH
jgi:hypothetical protein